MQHKKVQSTGKVVTFGKELDEVVSATLAMIAETVGCTLGPGGKTVIVERQEEGLPPLVTKDGVTVFRNLGFEDSTAQVVMEAARDAAVRTANEAGDGTTTATVLADAIYRKSRAFAREWAASHISPQKIVRRLNSAFAEVVEPLIAKMSIPLSGGDEESKRLLRAIARTSSNGDDALASAVAACFDLVGDDGNVTITEMSGPSAYEVESLSGYGVPHGWDDCCGKYAAKFITDPGRQRTVYEDPTFVVYHGQVTDIQALIPLMEAVGQRWQKDNGRHNVVIVAAGFSESVIGHLAINAGEIQSINAFPLRAPLSPVPGGQLALLEDVCAYTGATMFDPLNKPLSDFSPELGELGELATTFEAQRFRSIMTVDFGDEGSPSDAAVLVGQRVAVIREQVKQDPSSLDASIMEERIGKLTGGIAKLKVVGSSHGDVRERRDRAEDAVCAARGAIRHGCLPGGGWALLSVAHELRKLGDDAVDDILGAALEEPVKLLLRNVGFTDDEVEAIVCRIQEAVARGERLAYDALRHEWVDPVAAGLLDSTPAVRDAVRNALSIAAQLATTGAMVVFPRDGELERREAREARSVLLGDPIPANPADEKG